VSRHVRVALVAVVALGLVATGCGSERNAAVRRRATTTTTTTTTPPTTTTAALHLPLAFVAEAIVPQLAVYNAPEDSEPSQVLDNPWVVNPNYPDQTVPQVFLVKEARSDGWVRVLLPVRPNGSIGWVHASDVRVAGSNFHVTVELGAHRITVTQDQAVIYQGDVAVGTSDTPTPIGEYYVRVKIQAVDPTTAYGPYAWGLSSHSDVLETFNGSDAEIGIHGNNDASVLGHNVTHGCVRIDNDAITSLTQTVPLGTPVDIVA
jgi:lipoprotein-anchoring transpeptidase ErfK/SrfK